MNEFLSDHLLGPLLERAAVGIAVVDADDRFLYINRRLAEVNGVPQEAHIGRPVEEVIPHIADSVGRLHAEVMRTREPVRDVQIAGSTPGAPDRVWQVSYLPVETDGAPAVGVVLIDVTDRERAVAAGDRRVHQHAAVADLGQRALAGAEIQGLLDSACEIVRTELDAERSGVLELVPDADCLLMRAGAGWPAGAVGRMTADFGRDSQAGYTLLEDAPVLSRDLIEEERYQITAPILELGARSSISTPIPGGPRPFGVLGVFADDVDHFDEDDAGFVRAVANVLGTAVVREGQERALARLSAQRGRLVAQALEAGEREQRQVADVLHDDVLQHLLFARHELAEVPSAGPQVDRAAASVEAAATMLRRVVAGIHPVTLAHAGLAAALESLAGEHRARTGLETAVHVDPEAEGRHDRLVVSIIRELLTNVTKHAEAQQALVRLTRGDGELHLTVSDDGLGMPDEALASALGSGNIGLATVRERVEALGGTIWATSGLRGAGTSLHVLLPI